MVSSFCSFFPPNFCLEYLVVCDTNWFGTTRHIVVVALPFVKSTTCDFLTSKSVRKVCVAWRPKKWRIMISLFFPDSASKWFWKNHTSHALLTFILAKKNSTFFVTIEMKKKNCKITHHSKFITSLGKWDNIKVEHWKITSRFISNGEN